MEKKGFKDWLVISDVDGTLNDRYRRTVKANIGAIGEFTDNGGNFTIASGRNLQSALKIYDRLGVKTPLIFLNGAGIYDNGSKTVLSFQSVGGAGQAAVFDISERYASAEITVHTRDMIYLVKPRIFGRAFTFLDSLDHKICGSLFEVPRGDWGKVTIFDKPKTIEKIGLLVNTGYNSAIKAVFTSRYTLEITDTQADKGQAAKKLAEVLGIDMRHTAAVGDYYNDLDMLGAVAVSACCAKAPPKVKAACVYCACGADKGAVADFLGYLTENYMEK